MWKKCYRVASNGLAKGFLQILMARWHLAVAIRGTRKTINYIRALCTAVNMQLCDQCYHTVSAHLLVDCIHPSHWPKCARRWQAFWTRRGPHMDPCSADSTTTAVSLARAVRSHTRSLIRSMSATILAPRNSLSLPATLLRPLSLTSTASSGAGNQNYCFVAVNTAAILFTAAINAASHACLMPKISAIAFIYMGARCTWRCNRRVLKIVPKKSGIWKVSQRLYLTFLLPELYKLRHM